MWIQVRTFDAKQLERVDNLSKLTKIEELREKLAELFDADPERQRLFYRGKQLVDGHTLFDYEVRQNDLIQIMIRPPADNKENETESEKAITNIEMKDLPEPDKDDSVVELNEPSTSTTNSSVKEIQKESETEEEILENAIDYDDALYKVGDYVDVRDPNLGAWFEAIVLKVTVTKNYLKNVASGVKSKEDDVCTDEKDSVDTEGIEKSEDKTATDVNENDIEMKVKENKYEYHVRMETDDDLDDEKLTVRAAAIRPRSQVVVPFYDLEIDQDVMVNYNYDDKKKRGYWYDGIVTRVQQRRTQKELFCTVMVGRELAPLHDCQIHFVNEIMAIEKPGKQINLRLVKEGQAKKPKLRKNKAECDACQDNPNIQCKQCWCNVCGGKDRPELQIMCDECDLAYHITCLTPPLEKLPEEDDWYCPSCKNSSDIIKAGDKLKASKKKSKMASATNKTSRDWGKGMACAGRTKICTLVPTNHFGPIPGVEVGTLWKFRVQVSEAGIHRPHVAGISGRENEGAYSIVLSGGYEDDHDDGDEFFYTGSGGRDLSGNKRTAEQSCDQVLTRMNMALAKNCSAPINKKDGSESQDWKKGKSVRVVRNCKARKHSEYAPEEGNRYDGIYKIVKYWSEPGKSGFLVWRYLLRRDDPTPAPWTKEGRKRIKELCLEMQYPEGYLDKEREKEEKKRKGGDGVSNAKKKQKLSPKKFELDTDVKTLINEDNENKKVWQRAFEIGKDEGRQKFMEFIQEELMCICCQELVCRPITTKCSHNLCKKCLSRAFKADVYSCPACRTELGKNYSMELNENLQKILLSLFPGYEVGR